MTRSEKKKLNDTFLMGVLVALHCAYSCDAEGAAEEIVFNVGAAPLLRVAKAEDDPCLPNLRKTIRFLKSVNRA